MPIVPLSNVQLLRYAKLLRLAHFRGVFAKDSMPRSPRKLECGIVNLANSTDAFGTHWVAYRIVYPRCYYFDPIGNLTPPNELVKYFRGLKMLYNYDRFQSPNSQLCGHWCLSFLNNELEFLSVG